MLHEQNGRAARVYEIQYTKTRELPECQKYDRRTPDQSGCMKYSHMETEQAERMKHYKGQHKSSQSTGIIAHSNARASGERELLLTQTPVQSDCEKSEQAMARAVREYAFAKAKAEAARGHETILKQTQEQRESRQHEHMKRFTSKHNSRQSLIIWHTGKHPSMQKI